MKNATNKINGQIEFAFHALNAVIEQMVDGINELMVKIFGK